MCIYEFSLWRKVPDGQTPIRNAKTFANFNVSSIKRTSLADATRWMKQAALLRR